MINNSIKQKIGSILQIFLASCFLLFIIANPAEVYADYEAVLLSIHVDNNEVKEGDTLKIPVTFSHVPQIGEFGPIELRYNPALFSFFELERNPDLPDIYEFSSEDDLGEGIVTISCKSSEYSATATEDEPIENPADPVAETPFISDEPVEVFILSFVVRENVPRTSAYFSLVKAGTFTDFFGRNIEAGAKEQVFVSVASTLSGDAALKSLSPDADYPLEPTFQRDIYSYTMTVPGFVDTLSFSAQPASDKAQMLIFGGQNLRIGENKVAVQVRSEDGMTQRIYEITVLKKEEKVMPDSSVLGHDDSTYLIAEPDPDFIPPVGFEAATIAFRDEKRDVFLNIPGYQMGGTDNFLFYGKEKKDSEPVLYLYIAASGEIVPYDENKIYIAGYNVYFISETKTAIPKGFVPGDLIYKDRVWPAYMHADDNVYLLYLENEQHIGALYIFDRYSGAIFPYLQLTAESNYMAPLLLVGGFALIEFLLLMIFLNYTDAPLPGKKRIKENKK